MSMKTFVTHRLVKGEDLNHHGTLFAGRSAEWFVESGFIAAAATTIVLDGRSVTAYEGETVATVLLAEGATVREHASLLRLVANSVPALMAFYDADTMRCLFANAGYARTFGFSEQTILGRTLEEIVGKATMAVIERDYPNVHKRFTALGPLMNKVGNGGKGIGWKTGTEVEQLGQLNGKTLTEGVTQGMPKIVTDIDAYGFEASGTAVPPVELKRCSGICEADN